jgi:hypothetical protein
MSTSFNLSIKVLLNADVVMGTSKKKEAGNDLLSCLIPLTMKFAAGMN